MTPLRIVAALALSTTLGACVDGIPRSSSSAASTPAGAMVSAPPPAELKRVTVSGDRVTRTVDCQGADVTIAASDGTVTLLRCSDIIISGNREHVNATLLPLSAILVLGDHNVVRWKPTEGNSNSVRDQGKRNITAPL